jgi:hypothetical protein
MKEGKIVWWRPSDFQNEKEGKSLNGYRTISRMRKMENLFDGCWAILCMRNMGKSLGGY